MKVGDKVRKNNMIGTVVEIYGDGTVYMEFDSEKKTSRQRVNLDGWETVVIRDEEDDTFSISTNVINKIGLDELVEGITEENKISHEEIWGPYDPIKEALGTIEKLDSNIVEKYIPHKLDKPKLHNREYFGLEIGTKNDSGKPRMSLLDQDALDAMLRVLEDGARRHGDRNWEKVDPKRFMNALYRHAGRLRDGEIYDTDPEGIKAHHAANLLCNSYFLYKLMKGDK